VKRSRSHARIKSDAHTLDSIIEIKSDHPLWGYRRIWGYLRYRKSVIVGKNRIYRIMKENKLLISKKSRFLAKRKPMRPKPRASRPNQFWGTDMTKVKVGSFGWVYLHIVLDWYTKEIIGYSFSFQSKSKDWLDALNMAVNSRYPHGILDSPSHPQLISDNGCQPTSERYMKSCSELGIRQIFTSWNNPKGNADTERVFRTMKEDLVWPYDWQSPFIFQDAFVNWICDYNCDFPHQSLAYKTPAQSMAFFTSNLCETEVPIF
jgi:transposase InsO family protein